MKMRKRILCFLIAAIFTLSMPMTACASVAASTIGTDRTSNTSGKVSAYAMFNKEATKATCSITLQVKSGDSWVTATNLPVYAYIKTVSGANSITAGKTFTLKSGKVYRAKIVFTDKNSSGTYTKTRYTGSF